MLNLDPPISHLDGIGVCPGDAVIADTLAAQLREPHHRGIDPYKGIPGCLAHDTIHIQSENLLEFPYRGLCLGAENTVHRGDFGDCRIILRNPIQFGLDNHHAGTGKAPADGPSGVGSRRVLDRGIVNDLYIAIVASQDLDRAVALLSQILAAPLAETLTGHRGSVAEFSCQGLHDPLAADVIVEQFIHQLGDIIKEASAVDKKLIIGSRAGDVKIITPAAVELGINPVQGKRDNGQYVGPKRAFLPGRIDLTGRYVFNIVHKRYGHIGRGGIRRAQVDRDPLGDVGYGTDRGQTITS